MAMNYQQMAGAPPGPGGPFDDLRNQVPLAGPVLASVFQLLDQYANALPRRIAGGLLGTPGLGDVLSAGADREGIMRRFKQEGPQAAFQQFSDTTPIPFGGVALESLSDPLLGLGPVSRLGGPVRGAIGGGIRGALNALPGRTPVTSALRGSQTLSGSVGLDTGPIMQGISQDAAAKGSRFMPLGSTPARQRAAVGQMSAKIGTLDFEYDMLTAPPQADAVATGMARTAEISNRILGGIPGRIGGSLRSFGPVNSALAHSDRQRAREISTEYMNLMNYIGSRVDMPIMDWFKLSATEPVAKLEGYLIDRGVPDEMAKLFRREVKPIMAAATAAEQEKMRVLNLGRGLLADMGLPPLPVPKTQADADLIRNALRAQGVNTVRDLPDLAMAAFGPDSPRVAETAKKIETFLQRAVDPLNSASDADLIVAKAIERRERLMTSRQAKTGQALRMAATPLTFINNIERETGILSIPYYAFNRAWNVMAQTAYGVRGRDALGDAFTAMKVGWDAASGKFAGMSAAEQRLAAIPPYVRGFSDMLDIPVPAKLHHGLTSAMFDISETENLLDVSKSAVRQAGPWFPLLTGLLGAAANAADPISVAGGAAVGGIAGSVIQRLAPKVRVAEQIADSFARTAMWQRETARATNNAFVPFIDNMLASLTPTGGTLRAARNAPTAEQVKALADNLMRTHGQVSAEDMALIVKAHVPGITEPALKRIRNEWGDILHSASRSGEEAAAKAMIIPKTTNMDEKLKMVLVFHHWATRQVPWIAEQIFSSPQAATLVLRQMADAEKEMEYRGLPDRLGRASAILWPESFLLGGLMEAFIGKGTMYGDPTVAVTPLTSLADASGSPGEGEFSGLSETLRFAQNLGMRPTFVIRWLMTLNGWLGKSEPSPDFFRHGQFVRNLPIGGTDINEPLRNFTNAWRTSMGQEPGEFQEYATRRRVRELAQERGMAPNSPAVRAMEANPQSELYRQAAEEIRKQTFGMATIGLTSPLPISLRYLSEAEGNARFARTQAVRGEGLRSDLGSLYAPTVDVLHPETTTYRGMSFEPPTMPGLQQLLRGSNDPRMTDPRALTQAYLAWAEAQGIPAEQVWDNKNLQRYFKTRSANIELSREISGKERR